MTIKLEDFIQMFQKKKMEYLTNKELSIESDEAYKLDNFQYWLMQQTGQYKKLKAERKELLSLSDMKNTEIRNFIDGKWGDENSRS